MTRIRDICFIRDGKQRSGRIKPVVNGFKLRYQQEEVSIKTRDFAEKGIIEIDRRKYQFIENRVRTWPLKEKVLVIKRLDGRIFFQTPKKDTVMKIVPLNGIVRLEFPSLPPDIPLCLFAGFYYSSCQSANLHAKT